MAKTKKAKRGRAKSEAQKIPKLSMTPGKRGANLELMREIEAYADDHHYSVSMALRLLVLESPGFIAWRRGR